MLSLCYGYGLSCFSYLVAGYENLYFPFSGSAQSETAQADAILKAFFTPVLLEHVTLSLVVQYLPLNQTELNTWDEDPEASVCDEGGESWKYAMRVSAHCFWIGRSRVRILAREFCGK